MVYSCFKCGKEFTQKGHLETHIFKKNDCRLCNTNFKTDYVYIDNEAVHVDEYILCKDTKFLKKNLYCQKGHKLVLVNGKTRKKHFRHKNSKDVGGQPMSEWHSMWQGHFPNTEVPFKKCSDKQHRDRFADVHFEEHKIVLEIQHSQISIEEVSCRNDDYSLNNQSVIWLVDGNTHDIKYEKLNSNDGYLIIFNNEWKFKSFISTYDFILLDIHDKIFKIPVKKVCAKMILLKEFKKKEDVIKKLISEPKNIWEMWSDDNEVKAKLTVRQQGAGNGKTYGIWKSILENKNKKNFFIVTKQHTAKTVIREELCDQVKRGESHIITNIEEKDDIVFNKYNKQYTIRIKNNHNNKEKNIIIGTVDSFVNAITTNKKSAIDYFTGLLNTINETGECNKINSMGSMYYAGNKRKLTCESEVWIDEAQDLPAEYYTAIMKLMCQTKVDVVIVGDKLQSLQYEKNFMTEAEKDGKSKYHNNNTFIQFNIPEASNENRRIKTNDMGKKINDLVHFHKYGIPEITSTPLAEQNEKCDSITTFKMNLIYANDTNKEKIKNNIDTIMKFVKYEVKNNNYKPNDFLFVFPIMKCNVIAKELETILNEYWREEIYKDNNKYKSYAILHKHQEGQVIDTGLSKDSSRIMSIRSSKGDGRKVVFVLNCNESSLKMVSNGEINLLFESHFHVSLTRAKNKIYFGLQHNGDEIHKRFGMRGYVPYIPEIRTKIQLTELCKFINKQKLIDDILKKNKIDDYEENSALQSSPTIDWGFHCIRHAVYYVNAIFSVLKYDKKNKDYKESQLFTILKKISKLTVISCSPKEFYSYLREVKQNDGGEFAYFPLCRQSQKPIYTRYCNKIEKIMKTIQKFIKENPLNIVKLQPIEMVILIYMIDIYTHHKYHDITPREIYDIIDFFEKENDKIKDLINESENIKKIVKQAMDDITENNKDIIWNIEHMLFYGGKTTDFSIRMNVPIIGYDDNNVYHIKLQTDYSQLNHWDTMTDILIERFLIKNPNSNDRKKNNMTRYKGKKIKTYLFVLKKKDYITFDWNNWEENVNSILKELSRQALLKYFSEYHKPLFQYYKMIKKNKDEWNENCRTPMEYLYKIYKTQYVVDFFKYLENKHKEGNESKKWVKKITDTESEFILNITNHLDNSLQSFFGLLDNNIESDEEF